MKNNQKILKVICIKDYVERVLDGSKPNTNQDLYFMDLTLFKQSDIAYCKKEDGVIYVASKKDHLYKLKDYHTYITDIDEKQFFKHFKYTEVQK